MMGKKSVKLEPQGASVTDCIAQIKKALGPSCACCVVITCSEPAEDGNMQVEMHFEGEESLAALLLESAGQIFDNRSTRRDVK